MESVNAIDNLKAALRDLVGPALRAEGFGIDLVTHVAEIGRGDRERAALAVSSPSGESWLSPLGGSTVVRNGL
jgi:hypothetical protein